MATPITTNITSSDTIKLVAFDADGTREIAGTQIKTVLDIGTITHLDADDGRPEVACVARANQALSGTPTLHNYQTVVGDRVLMTAQTDATKNRVYIVASGSWSPAGDSLVTGAWWHALYGDYAATTWILTTAGTIVPGTTELAVVMARARPADFAHASTHASGGGDAVTIAQSQVTGLADALAGKASNAFANIVVGSDTIAADSANDTLTLVAGSNITLTGSVGSDAITIAGAASGTGYTDEAAQDAIGGILTDTASVNLTYNDTAPSITADVIFGTTSGTVCQGNDARLSDARTPTAHEHSATEITSGTLSTDRFSAYADLTAESKIGTGGTQVAAGDHTHAQLHAAVTLAGTPDYITLSGQELTRNQIDLTADVTGDLPLSNIAQASAASRLLGRGSAAGAGDFQEVTLGSGLSMSGTELSATGSAGMASVATIANLPGSPTDDDLVYVRGYAADEDGGGGIFRWDAASTATAVQGLIIGTGTGRWIRQYSGAINVRWCGAKGDGTTDDTTAINAALGAGPTLDQSGHPLKGMEVFIPAGRYLISAPLVIKTQGTVLRGAGCFATHLVAHSTFAADGGGQSLGKWLVIAEDSYLKGPTTENLYGPNIRGFCLDFQWSTDVRGIYGGGLRNGASVEDIQIARTGLCGVKLTLGGSNSGSICQGVSVERVNETEWNVGSVQPRTEPMIWFAQANECVARDCLSAPVNTYRNTGCCVQNGSADYWCGRNQIINCGGANFRGADITVASGTSFQVGELIDVTLETGKVFTAYVQAKNGNVLQCLSGESQNDGTGSAYIPEIGKNAVGRTSAASSAISAATFGAVVKCTQAWQGYISLGATEMNVAGIVLDGTGTTEGCVGISTAFIGDFAITSCCAVAAISASNCQIHLPIGQERVFIGPTSVDIAIQGAGRQGNTLNVVTRSDVASAQCGMARNTVNGYAIQGGSSGNFSLFLGGEAGEEPAYEIQTTGSYTILRPRTAVSTKIYAGTPAAPVPAVDIATTGDVTLYSSGGTKGNLRSTNDDKLGFFNATAVAKPTSIGNAPQELAAAFETMGLIDAKDYAVWVDANTTLTSAHQGQLLVCSNGISLTVNNSTDFAAYGYCDIFNVGAAVTVVDTATVNKVGSLSIPQYGYARLRRTNTADAYVLTIFEAASSHTHTVDDTVDAVANQYAARNSGDTDDEARTDKRLAMWAAPITADGTYPLALWGNIPVTLTEVSARTVSGTCSIKIQKGGSDINGFGSAVAQTTAVTDTASTEAIAEDAYLTIVVSSASSLTGLLVTLKGARTGN